MWKVKLTDLLVHHHQTSCPYRICLSANEQIKRETISLHLSKTVALYQVHFFGNFPTQQVNIEILCV